MKFLLPLLVMLLVGCDSAQVGTYTPVAEAGVAQDGGTSSEDAGVLEEVDQGTPPDATIGFPIPRMPEPGIRVPIPWGLATADSGLRDAGPQSCVLPQDCIEDDFICTDNTCVDGYCVWVLDDQSCPDPPNQTCTLEGCIRRR